MMMRSPKSPTWHGRNPPRVLRYTHYLPFSPILAKILLWFPLCRCGQGGLGRWSPCWVTCGYQWCFRDLGAVLPSAWFLGLWGRLSAKGLQCLLPRGAELGPAALVSDSATWLHFWFFSAAVPVAWSSLFLHPFDSLLLLLWYKFSGKFFSIVFLPISGLQIPRYFLT